MILKVWRIVINDIDDELNIAYVKQSFEKEVNGEIVHISRFPSVVENAATYWVYYFETRKDDKKWNFK